MRNTNLRKVRRKILRIGRFNLLSTASINHIFQNLAKSAALWSFNPRTQLQSHLSLFLAPKPKKWLKEKCQFKVKKDQAPIDRLLKNLTNKSTE
jgi:hypothetical protein